MPRTARRLGRLVVLTILSCLVSGVLAAAAAPPERDTIWSDMHWRLVGPFRGGWATAASGVPGNPAIWYFGSADGGVWKTTDAGVTWRPLFNDQSSASIGAMTVAPGDPNVIWVGTGQMHQRWDIVDGDGVYRSTDGGATWSHLGLAETKHIGAIWVDPRDPSVAVVAALGHVFGPNEQRGLFRTEDGGATWEKVLDSGSEVGAVDVAGDPAHPDRLFASLWQVRRHPWLDYFQPPVGPGSGIVRSSNGGRTWEPVGSKGLPEGPLGRIELAVSPGTDARRVWAAIQSETHGGLYRSDDGGETWEQVNTDRSLASDYMSGLVPDPGDPDVIWAMGRSMRRSTDAGRTFRYVKGSPGGDDYHFLWIDPTDARRMILGADQGAVVTLNGGETWSSWYNQPTGQFYRLGVDDRFPYWIYSGQQDSGTVGIASRSDYGQITFRDWHPVGGDERDGDVPDPADPRIVYGAGLGGRLSKWNAVTAQVQNVSPWPVGSYADRPGTSRYRYDWITPLAIAPRPPHALYLGAQVLFRSLDSGQTWQTVSPDVTGADPEATGCDGVVPMARATACGFGTIFAISPSAAADGLVWLGTDNGRVMVTRDDSKTWTDVTPPGMADWTKVNLIDASPTDPATAYVAADAHRRDDFRPMIFRTHDYGATWTEVGHGLPDGAWVGVVRQDPQHPGLLYAGTSRGVHVSYDDGGHWRSLQLDLPTTGINDLRVHHDDLIAATQGRAIWILDDLAPLRYALATPSDAVVLVPPVPAYRLRGNQNKDTPLPPEEPRGENPPVGAVIDYVLPKKITGPVTLQILDAAGGVVKQFASDDEPESIEADVYFTDRYLGPGPRLPATPGHHRFVWNLRYDRPRALEYEYSIAAVPDRETDALPQGAFVLPGAYRVRLTAAGKAVEQPLAVLLDPRVEVEPGELTDLLAFSREVASALARSADLERARGRAEKLLEAAATDERARRLARRVVAQREALGALTASRTEDPARINGRLASLATDLEGVDAAPTAPQRELLDFCEKGIAAFESKWTEFTNGAFADLSRRLEKLGVESAGD